MPNSALNESPEIGGRETVNVLRGIDGVADDGLADVSRQWELNHDPVNFTVMIQPMDQVQLKNSTGFVSLALSCVCKI